MEEQEIHLRDYWRVVVKRRHTVATIFGIIFLVTVIGTFSVTPIYKATTTLLIEKSEPDNVPVNNPYYNPYDPEFYETQHQLLKSVSVAERVVHILSLDKTYETYFRKEQESIVSRTMGWLGEMISAVLGKPQSAEEKKEVSARLAKMISSSIIVTPVKNTKLVDVSYMSTNPEFAALIVNTISRAYMEDLLDMRMSFTQYTMRWLEEKAAEEKVKLESSEQALQEYMKEKDIVTLENRIAMLPERLTQVGNSLAEAETKRKEKETLYNQVKGLVNHLDKADTIPAISSDPMVQSIRMQILKAEQNITDLSKKFGKKHPAMVTASEDLRILREKKDQEVRRVIESIKNDYELAKANEVNLLRTGSEAKMAAQNLNEKFVQYGVLKRDADTSRQLFESIIRRMKEKGVTEDIRTVDVSVVEKADVPKSPAKPRKVLNIILGLIVGLAGGIGLAFFVEYIDNTVKMPEEAESKIGAPVLGLVTLLKSRQKNIEEMVLKEPQSTFAESYRAIRTSILLSCTGSPLKNILISSISPGEGKTVTAVNLAAAIAHSEHSVLLIDSDLRRPRIHKIFGIDNSKGLSTFLAGASDINVVTVKGMQGLNILPSGPIPPNPSELLSSARMQNLLKAINGRFDIVVWDSAPLMTVTDSLVLSKIVDGTIVVAKAGETTYENVTRGIKSLREIDARFLGIIINALDVKKDDYYFNRYYSYRYSYGHKPE